MKRLSLLTAALLSAQLLLLPLSAYADPVGGQTQEATLSDIRSQFQLSTSDWTLQSVTPEQTLGDFKNPETGWTFQFVGKSKETQDQQILVKVGHSGQLYEWNRTRTSQFGNLLHEAALQKAQAFLQKYAPEAGKTLLKTQDEYNNANQLHTFTYVRTVNGVPVPENHVEITIDNVGNVREFTLSAWSKETFPSAQPSLTQDQLHSAYKNAFDMRLEYDTYTDSPSLVYRPYFTPATGLNHIYKWQEVDSPVLDAQTGQALNAWGEPLKYSTNRAPVTSVVPGGPLQPNPLPHMLTQAEADSLVKSWNVLPANATLKSGTMLTTDPYWELHYATPAGVTTKAVVDAKYGEPVEIWTEFPTETRLSSQFLQRTPAEWDAQAVDLLKKMLPNRTGALVSQLHDQRIQDASASEEAVYFFPLLINGIPSTSHGVSMRFDAQTGALELLTVGPFPDLNNISSQDYPPPTGIVTASEAAEAYMQARPVHLAYILRLSQPPLLVYTSNLYEGYERVIAKTGQYTIPLGPYQPQPIPTLPSSMQTHWGASALRLFYERSLVTESKYPNPDVALTRSAVVQLLIDYTGARAHQDVSPQYEDVLPTYEYYDQIQIANANGWIAKDTKFRPEDAITREEVAAILARVLSSEVKNGTSQATPTYADASDISPWARSAIALHQQLGLMQGSDGKFYPKQNITLAEMCTLLVNLGKLTDRI